MALTPDDIEDIKQLLQANNYMLLAEVDELFDRKFDEKFDQKFDQKFDEKFAPIQKQITDLTDFVTEAIDTTNDVHGVQLKDHEARITSLEQSVA